MNSPENNNGWKQPAAIAAMAIICIGGLASAYWFGLCDKQSCGQFGDFLGGVLNPLIGAVTLGALFWTVKAQRETLRLTKETLEHSKQEARSEMHRSDVLRLEEQSAKKSAKAVENYEGMMVHLERAMSIPMFSLGGTSHSLLQVIEGAASSDCLQVWLRTPPDSRSQRHKLYASNVSVKLELTISAAKKARRYLPPERWEAERRQLLAVIVACYTLSVVDRVTFDKLITDIEGGDPAAWIELFQ